MDHLFIVRIWSEPSEGASHFRASVEHVGTRFRRYFDSPAELAGYMRTRVDEALHEDRPPAFAEGPQP